MVLNVDQVLTRPEDIVMMPDRCTILMVKGDVNTAVRIIENPGDNDDL